MTVAGGLKQAPTNRGGAMLRRIGTNLAAWFSTLVRPPRIAAARWWPLWPLTGRVVLGAVVSILLVAGIMIAFDASAITGARGLPPWLVNIFGEITDFGKSGWFLWPIGILLLVIAALASPELPRFSQLVLATIVVRLGFLFLAIGLPGLFGTIVKRLIGRARPFVSGIADPYVYKPFDWSPAYASLPSGHATTAFAAAVAVGALWPKARPVMWIYAVVIAVSRVIVTAHHPSDVIAGAIVGTVGALLARSWFASRRLGFAIDADGRVRALPGPSLRRVKKVAARLGGA
jgi:undecaprenyl-diphosphatase